MAVKVELSNGASFYAPDGLGPDSVNKAYEQYKLASQSFEAFNKSFEELQIPDVAEMINNIQTQYIQMMESNQGKAVQNASPALGEGADSVATEATVEGTPAGSVQANAAFDAFNGFLGVATANTSSFMGRLSQAKDIKGIFNDTKTAFELSDLVDQALDTTEEADISASTARWGDLQDAYSSYDSMGKSVGKALLGFTAGPFAGLLASSKAALEQQARSSVEKAMQADVDKAKAAVASQNINNLSPQELEIYNQMLSWEDPTLASQFGPISQYGVGNINDRNQEMFGDLYGGVDTTGRGFNAGFGDGFGGFDSGADVGTGNTNDTADLGDVYGGSGLDGGSIGGTNSGGGFGSGGSTGQGPDKEGTGY